MLLADLVKIPYFVLLPDLDVLPDLAVLPDLDILPDLVVFPNQLLDVAVGCPAFGVRHNEDRLGARHSIL